MWTGDSLGGKSKEGEKERKGYWGVKRIEVHYIYIFKDSIIKPTKYCLKRQGEERENANIMEGMNLFKVLCTHVWNYHNETPLNIMYTNSKI
jgi:hypothetical protein